MYANSHVLVLPPDSETNDNPAVIIPSNRSNLKPSITSYAQLNYLSCSLQRSLALNGVTKDGKVALVLPNSLEFVAAFLAVVRQRAVAVLLNAQLKQSEYRQMLSLTDPALVIVVAHATAPTNGADAEEPAALVAAELGFPVATLHIEQNEAHLETRCCNGDATAARSAPSRSTRVFSPQEVEAEDKALLLLTSGTTGPPKAVMLSHTNLLVAMRIIISAHELSLLDRCLVVTPLFHIIGVGGSLLTTLFTGGCVVIPPSLPGYFWKMCDEFRITWFHAVPTIHRLITAFPIPDGKVPPTLRFLRSGGSDMAPDLYAKLRELGPPILEVYGMTETAPAIFCNQLHPSNAVGRRLGHYPVADAVDVMILPPLAAPNEHQPAERGNGVGGAAVASNLEDPVRRLTKKPGVAGEICVRGKSVMAGYVDNPEANREAFLSNGFFRTGDLGMIHSDGYLQLSGRIKEIINKGGEKISPSEIEHLILTHEAVKEAACFRVADEMYGEEIGNHHYPAIQKHPTSTCPNLRTRLIFTCCNRPGCRFACREAVQTCRAQKSHTSTCCAVQSSQSGKS